MKKRNRKIRSAMAAALAVSMVAAVFFCIGSQYK